MGSSMPTLTDRQIREIEYHKAHAAWYRSRGEPVSYDLIQSKRRRWWNASWAMYTHLMKADLRGRKVLVAGCGFGADAVRLARMGACVYAFDLSPDVLDIARTTARAEGVDVVFAEMPAENLHYPGGVFDCIVARDILHHVRIDRTMAELKRVAAAGAMFVANEVYSHSLADKVRHSRVVTDHLYPRMVEYVYDNQKPYITDDERKLDQRDIRRIRAVLSESRCEYFSFFVTRLVPPRFTQLAKMDRLVLKMLGSAGGVLAGRVLLTGRM